MFDLYESGLNGRETGHKEIAADLKHRGSLLRSTKDSRNRVRRRIRIQPRARRTWNGTLWDSPNNAPFVSIADWSRRSLQTIDLQCIYWEEGYRTSSVSPHEI